MRKNYAYPRLKTLPTIEIFLEKYFHNVELIENQSFINHGHLVLGQKSKLLYARTGPGSLSDATSYCTWQEAGERSFSLPLSSICYFINLESDGRRSKFWWNSGLIWCVAQFIPYSDGGGVNTLTGLVFFLRNICTLWWRFLMMRFLFWTQIWWCHSRQGPLQECLTWWLNRPQGECVFPCSVDAGIHWLWYDFYISFDFGIDSLMP